MKRKFLLYSFVTAVLFLFVGTASSPLFPFNVWDDANCFFTVGKSLFHGKVLYRDIFEQKGLYLYVLFGLGGFIKSSGFLGIYFLEVVFYTVFLYYTAKLLSYYVGEKYIYVFLPVLSLLLFTSPSFEKGGSAEEFCLPLFMIVLCHAIEILDEKGSGFKISKIWMDAVCVAVVFWIKYNLTFLFVGIYLGYLVSFIQKKRIKELGTCIGVSVLGMAAGSLPALLYFYLNHAMGDLWFGYFYANLFLYHGYTPASVKIRLMIEHLVRYLKANYVVGFFVALGLVGFIKRRYETLRLGALFLPLSLLFIIFGCVYVPAVVGVYYSLPLIVFSVFGMAEFGMLTKGRSIIRWKVYHGVILSACCLFAVYFGSNAYFLREIKKEELPQSEFAKIIHQKKNPTVLNYGCLDTGIYTIADVEPVCRFFCQLNLESYEEMFETQKEMIDEKKVDFIVTLTWTQEPESFDGYEQVGYKEMYLTGNSHYHLYQKTED